MRIVSVPIIICVGFCALIPIRASGQTSSTPTATPSPTPTSTPSTIPAGSDLITQMQKAVAGKNSFHTVTDMRANIPGEFTVTTRAVADLSNKPVRAHQVTTEKGSETANGITRRVKTKSTLVVVGKRVASRTGSTRWKCQSLKSAVDSGSALLPTSSRLQNAVDLGADTRNNVAVWHVHADVVVDLGGSSGLSTIFGSQTLTIPVEFYVSQTDQTLVRETGSVDATVSGVEIHETFTENVSRYGETVKVKLPAACTK